MAGHLTPGDHPSRTMASAPYTVRPLYRLHSGTIATVPFLYHFIELTPSTLFIIRRFTTPVLRDATRRTAIVTGEVTQYQYL